ncbi:MAG: hypothetical protein KC502_08705 [Myxococcales bacterium]|nr:hypothetical protein [Myxococcales bacterium]
MSDGADNRLLMQVSRGCVQVSFHGEPTDATLARFRSDLLTFVRDTGADSVIVSLAGLRVIDSQEFASLKATLSMTQLLGVQLVITGLAAGLVASMVELGLDLPFQVGRDLDHGFDMIAELRAQRQQQ